MKGRGKRRETTVVLIGTVCTCVRGLSLPYQPPALPGAEVTSLCRLGPNTYTRFTHSRVGQSGQLTEPTNVPKLPHHKLLALPFLGFSQHDDPRISSVWNTSGWPGTHFAEPAILTFRDPPACLLSAGIKGTPPQRASSSRQKSHYKATAPLAGQCRCLQRAKKRSWVKVPSLGAHPHRELISSYIIL